MLRRRLACLFSVLFVTIGSANAGVFVSKGNPSTPYTSVYTQMDWLRGLNSHYCWSGEGPGAGCNYSTQPVSYEVVSAPPFVLNDLTKTMDTVTRLWTGLSPYGAVPYFYRADANVTGVPSNVTIRYQDDNYPYTWDVRVENGSVVFVLHKSVANREIDWKNHKFLFYYLANMIGVELLGKPVSAYPGDITWRPRWGQDVGSFGHIFTRRDVGSSSVYTDLVPVFSTKGNPIGFDLVVGLEEAITAEQSGKSLVFRGVAEKPGAFHQTYESYMMEYPRTNGKAQGYFRNGYNAYKGRFAAEFGSACIDQGAMYPVNGKANLTLWEASELDPYLPRYNPTGNGKEVTPVSVAMFPGSEAHGYQIVFDVPRGTGCYQQLGVIRSMRFAPLEAAW